MSSVQPGKLPELEPIQVPDPDLPLQRRLPGARAGLFAAVLVALVLIVIGAVGVHAQLDALKNELSGIRRELIGARDRIAQLERKVVEEPARQANEAARRVEERPRLELTREEVQLIRDYIKIPPAPAGAAATIQIGAVVPPGLLVPLPQQIGEKSPKLIGARFMTDQNGAIVIVSRTSRQADAIVAPH